MLQNAVVLLQNVTVITNCDDFITKCKLLQNATFMTNCDSTHGLLSNHLFQRKQEDGG